MFKEFNNKTIGELMDMLDKYYCMEDELKDRIEILENYICYLSNSNKRKSNMKH